MLLFDLLLLQQPLRAHEELSLSGDPLRYEVEAALRPHPGLRFGRSH